MFFLIFEVEIIEFDGKRIAITKKVIYTSVCLTSCEGKETRKHLFLKHIKEKIDFV